MCIPNASRRAKCGLVELELASGKKSSFDRYCPTCDGIQINTINAFEPTNHQIEETA
jgi:hypothetical protein